MNDVCKTHHWLILLYQCQSNYFFFVFVKENHVFISQNDGGAFAAGGWPPWVHQHVSYTSLTDHSWQVGRLPKWSWFWMQQQISAGWAFLCCTLLCFAARHLCFPHTPLTRMRPKLGALPRNCLFSVRERHQESNWWGICHRSNPGCSWPLLPDTVYPVQRWKSQHCTSRTARVVAHLLFQEGSRWVL